MEAKMRLASVFGDHAVMQRDIPAPVWGWTKPLVKVKARLGPYEARGMSGADGKFLVRLPPMRAGGPYDLEVSASGGGTARSTDILVGEVWVASGQSNMQMRVCELGAPGTAEAASAKDSSLRMLSVPTMAYLGRQTDIKASWQPTARGTTGNFSAVGYFFAKKLRAELGVPVGILNTSWGGTIVETWTSREWLVKNPYSAAWVQRYEADINSPSRWVGEKKPSDALPADPGNKGEPAGWAKPKLSESDWKEAELPRPWQTLGHNYSGVFWFRKTVDLPAAWAGKDLSLQIGAVDKQDITYFNGVQVGATGTGMEQEHWNIARDYSVPGRLVKAGPNTIAVRAFSFVYQGGMIGPASVMSVSPNDGSDQPIPIAGKWMYKEERNLGLVNPPAPAPGPGNPNSPYILYDTMLAPLIPFAIRGAIWYQGESNAGKAYEYRSLQTDMIRCWRHDWGQGDFPFLMVQLANYQARMDYQEASTWARLREAQTQTLSEPETGMAVAIDIGEAFDIHPKNKNDVGVRLAHWALAKTYNKDFAPSGPIYKSMSVEGDKIRLRFDHVAGGLIAKDGALKTFHVAGADRMFKAAKAKIDGDTVVVSSAEVDNPAAARYAWADNPEGCNLYNSTGLPASPFRTDSWA